jgi:hypothetical protein
MAAARETGNSTRGRRVVRRQARRGVRSSSRAALATAATLVVLLAAAAARADWDPVPPEAWQEPARPDSGGGDAIMLLDHADYRQESEKFHVDYFARARVFTAEGRDIGNVEIEFLKDRWKLTNVRGRCVTPGGKTTELDPAQILYTTSLSAKDLVVTKASATIPGIEPGCIVEWGYTLEGPSEEYNPWAFRFANRYYTCVSTHTWHPSSQDEAVVRKDWQYYGIQPVFVEETCLPNRERPREVTFTTRRQPGVRDEEMAPPAEDATPRVVVYYAPATITATGYWSGWKRMIDAYQDEMGKKSDALDGVLTAIREGHPEPEAALEATFHWVQGHLHSNAELPVERQPDAAKIRKSYRFAEDLGQLLGKSEADPLEINTLMALAAQRLGFTAYVALVGDRRFETFDHRVVGFPPFNAITAVMVGGRKIFLQPDSRFETFGSVPWYLRGGYGLLSGNGHDLFFFVPPDAGAGATSLWDLQVNLSDDGGMEGRVEARLAGEAARGWRRGLWDEPAADRTEYLRKRLAENEGPKADLEVPSLDTPPDSDLVLRGTARWPGVASATGDRIVVPIDRVIPWRTHGQFAPPRRKQNLLFRDHGVETFRVRFHLPAGMTADHLPDPQEFRNELGAWSERWTRDGADVVLERRLELALAEVPPQGYALVRDLFRSLQAADQTVLLVTRSR